MCPVPPELLAAEFGDILTQNKQGSSSMKQDQVTEQQVPFKGEVCLGGFGPRLCPSTDGSSQTIFELYLKRGHIYKVKYSESPDEEWEGWSPGGE